MIQIELPCCDTEALIEADTDTIRCEACAIEHQLAPEARPARPDAAVDRSVLAPAA